jgi:signal transduction histidine kinase
MRQGAAQAYLRPMATVATQPVALSEGRSRWLLAAAWLAGLIIYCIAIALASGRAAVWVNDIAWTLASGAAAFVCLRASRIVEPARRRAWRLLGIGCISWFIGQLQWNYSQLVLKQDLPFPTVGQLFFSALSVLVVVAVLQMPEARERTTFTFRHFGNVGLVSCCLVVTVVLGIVEPALQSGAPGTYLLIGLAHTLLVALTFITALYALWTYRWSSSWTPMLMLVIGFGIYAVANLVYAHSLLTGSYLPSDLINASWLVVFGLIATAAHEQGWLSSHSRTAPPQAIIAREAWLEAVVPALLIIIMVIVAVGSSAALTPRVVSWAAGLFILFAVILGVREAWIQNEAQQLTSKLVTINEQLHEANTELRLSETRYRELTTALEQRVAERTNELKRAYDELEGFSYAVAHDLKAPLRAINGFAHLFEAEMRGQLTEPAREHLARIRNGSLKMATLIDDLLSYSHVDRRGLQNSVVSLPVLIDSVIAQYSDEVQRRHVALSIEVEPIKLRVDAEGLLLALRNLFENSLKYTRQRSQPRVEVRARVTEHAVELTIADNGIGFDMEYHDHIFKIFQRLHRDDQYPGTGIGLALVRKAIERIGGRVWAQSEAGEGATFYVELPRVLVV